MRQPRFGICLSIMLIIWCLLAGCSTLTVRKVTNENTHSVEGIRYYLPRPHILVQPSEEGAVGFTVQVVHLPDYSQAYAIDSGSFMAKHELEIAVKNGFLKKVIWDENNTAVAAEIARASGDVAKARIDKDKADRDEAKNKQEERAAERKAAEKALADKELEIELAEAELAHLWGIANDPPTTSQLKAIQDKELELQKLGIQLDVLVSNLKSIQDEANEIADALNNPDGDAGKTAWGPMLYVIDDRVARDGTGSLSLRAVEWSSGVYQDSFRVIPPKKKELKVPRLTTIGEFLIKLKDGEFPEIAAEFTSAVTDLPLDDRSLVMIDATGNEVEQDTTLVIPRIHGGTKLYVHVRSTLPAGRYRLDLPFTFAESGDGEVEILFVAER